MMAIITCPECGKGISSFAKSCPHCGFPLDDSTKKDYNVILRSAGLIETEKKIWGEIKKNRALTGLECLDLTRELPSIILANTPYQKAIEFKDKMDAIGATVELIECDKTNHSEFFEILHGNSPVECPRCHSDAVTTGSRGFSILTGFIGSGKTVNRCAKCGYKWEP